jgi:hypothetical protein
MTHRRFRFVLAVLAAIAAAAPAVSGQEGFDGLVIRVYDMTGLDRRERADAIDVATALLADAGVDADWLDCRRSAGNPGSACEPYRRPTDLIVRLVHASTTVSSEASPALGVAVIEPSTRAGTLATIFIDRLRPVARRASVDPTLLLGRTMAHEVGHLLLRTNDHASGGLMRETWTDLELAANRAEDWRFEPHTFARHVFPPRARALSNR